MCGTGCSRFVQGAQKHIFASIKCAASFHCEVDDLVDLEEMTEEVKQNP